MRGLHHEGSGGEAGASEWVFKELGRLQLRHPAQSQLDPAQAAARLEHCIKNKVVFLQSAKEKQACGPRRDAERPPVSSRLAKQQGLYDVPREQCRFTAFQALHTQWCKHAAAVVTQHVETVSLPGRDGVLLTGVSLNEVVDHLNWHGAFVTVTRCDRPALCGVEGIVIKHTAKALHVVTPSNALHILPLKGATFRLVVGPHTMEVEGTALPPTLGGKRVQAAGGRQKNAPRRVDQHIWFA
jgi:RNase P/RNase MRP subunit p29